MAFNKDLTSHIRNPKTRYLVLLCSLYATLDEFYDPLHQCHFHSPFVYPFPDCTTLFWRQQTLRHSNPGPVKHRLPTGIVQARIRRPHRSYLPGSLFLLIVAPSRIHSHHLYPWHASEAGYLLVLNLAKRQPAPHLRTGISTHLLNIAICPSESLKVR